MHLSKYYTSENEGIVLRQKYFSIVMLYLHWEAQNTHPDSIKHTIVPGAVDYIGISFQQFIFRPPLQHIFSQLPGRRPEPAQPLYDLLCPPRRLRCNNRQLPEQHVSAMWLTERRVSNVWKMRGRSHAVVLDLVRCVMWAMRRIGPHIRVYVVS